MNRRWQKGFISSVACSIRSLLPRIRRKEWPRLLRSENRFSSIAEILFANPLREAETGTRIPFLRFSMRRREVRKWVQRGAIEDAGEPSRTGFAANRKVGG